MSRWIIVIFFILVLPGISAGGNVSSRDWYDNPGQGHIGWYGYQKYAEKEKKKTKNSQERQKKKEKKWPTYQEAMRMKPSQLKKILHQATDIAVGNPTEKNVTRWAQYIDVMRVKALRFTNVVDWLRQKNPDLAGDNLPVVTPGRYAMLTAQSRQENALLRRSASGNAMILFVSQRSPLSAPAENICRMFARDTGWRLEVVSVDRNPTLARAMGVKKIPQAWVISRRNYPPFPAMTGVVSESQLEDSVFRGLRIAEKLTKPTDYASPAPGVVNLR